MQFDAEIEKERARILRNLLRYFGGNKRKAAEKPPKPIKITCTEIQLKRAKQLYYALTVGFSIGYKDCKRFYLVP